MRYFVTGATGFIGKRLVRKLLAQKDSTVYFLVREESREKIPAVLEYWAVEQGRVVPVYGDICEEQLGISESDLSALSGTIDHFFHLAAIYDLNADVAPQVITNVEGTRNTVRLAGQLGAACFHHVSSIAAAGLYEGTFREDM
ncbi:MAG TPA: SDR family oxidoreductase, partial [Noviherbaspirillum sp.]|nr:SDR family oxidoreductase [Noviherbaspirillum sp.]